MMSTVSSQLLSAGSTIGEDIFHRYVFKDASEKKVVRITQIGIVAVAFAGILFALNSTENVFNLTVYATSGLAATYAAVLALALYWKKLTGPGCFVGMIGGFIICVAWQSAGLDGILISGVPGIAGSLLLAIVVSLFTKQKYEDEIATELERVKQDIVL